MKKFTYNIIDFEIKSKDSFLYAQNRINALAEDGWRVLSVNSFCTNQNALAHLTYTLEKKAGE